MKSTVGGSNCSLKRTPAGFGTKHKSTRLGSVRKNAQFNGNSPVVGAHNGQSRYRLDVWQCTDFLDVLSFSFLEQVWVGSVSSAITVQES